MAREACLNKFKLKQNRLQVLNLNSSTLIIQTFPKSNCPRQQQIRLNHLITSWRSNKQKGELNYNLDFKLANSVLTINAFKSPILSKAPFDWTIEL